MAEIGSLAACQLSGSGPEIAAIHHEAPDEAAVDPKPVFRSGQSKVRLVSICR